MVWWVPEWMKGAYGYVTGDRRRRRNRISSPSSGAGRGRTRARASSSTSTSTSSSSSQSRGTSVLSVQGARVKKRSPAAKSNAGKKHRKKKATDDGSSIMSEDDESSSEKITAAEQAAVSEESTMESPERLDRNDPKYASWTDAEIILFNQLQDRGLEPLLSTSYKLDFPTLPEEIFTTNDEEIFIDSRKGNELHTARALQNLFKVGGRIRPRMLERRHASSVLLRTINGYVKWTMEDADLVHRDLLPVLMVKASRAHEDHRGVIKRMRTDLRRLAVRHRELYEETLATSTSGKGRAYEWSEGSLNNSGPENTAMADMPSVPGAIPPPVLFGVIIVQGVMTFAALDASVIDADLKTVAIFDWAQSGQDVWNALAVAILVVMVRNYQESLGGDEVEGVVATDDPDA